VCVCDQGADTYRAEGEGWCEDESVGEGEMGRVKGGKRKERMRRANALVEKLADDAAQDAADIRALGVSVKDAADDGLFFIDKAPIGKEERRTKEARDEKLQRKRKLVLRNEMALLPNENVKEVSQTRIFKEKQLKDGMSSSEHKKVERMLSNGAAGERNGKKMRTNKVYDVWDGQEEELNEGSWWKVKPKRKGVSGPVASERKDKIVAGASANPSFGAHQNLLGEAVARDFQREVANQLWDERLAGVPPGDPAVDASAEESDDDDQEDQEQAVRKSQEKKTKTQRNREKRRKEAELELIKRTAQTSLKQEISNLDELISELDAKDVPDADKVARQTAKKMRRRIGGRQIPREELDLAMTHELRQHLRELKVKGSLVKDKFISLQRRGLAMAKSKRKRTSKRR